MSGPWTVEWFEECEKFYGHVLSGTYSHWCPEFNMPLDETDFKYFDRCRCFLCRGCGTLMKPKQYPFGRHPLEMHDDWFICPRRRFWNFWKHPNRDKHTRQWKI